MDAQQIIAMLIEQADNGRLITEKHDQANAAGARQGFRTMVCGTNPEMASFLRSGNYQVWVYHNAAQPQTPLYAVIAPNDPTIVTGSGIPSWSTTPTTACDRLIAVSGVQQGWHLYAESSQKIQADEAAGKIALVVFP